MHSSSISLHCHNLILLFFQSIQFSFNISIIIICNILSKIKFRPFIISPIFILNNIMFLFWDIELTSTSILFLELLDCRSCLLDTLCNSIRHSHISNFIVPLLWLGNMQLAHNGFCLLWIFSLLSQSVVKQNIAGLSSDI